MLWIHSWYHSRIRWRGRLVVSPSLVPEVLEGQIQFVLSSLELPISTSNSAKPNTVLQTTRESESTRESDWTRIYRNIGLEANSKNCSIVAARSRCYTFVIFNIGSFRTLAKSPNSYYHVDCSIDIRRMSALTCIT